jgi:hypothetical protein
MFSATCTVVSSLMTLSVFQGAGGDEEASWLRTVSAS